MGVIIISLFTESNTDLDQECVLFGELSSSFLDKIILNGYLVGTRSFWLIFPVLISILVFVIFGYKGLQLISFNSEYASSKGINVGLWNLVFMSMVSITTVMSFESVGAVLVIGLLVIPPSTAYLVSKKLKKMIFLSCLFVILAIIIGFYLSIYFDVSMSSMIIVTSGCIYFVSLSFKSLIFKRN